MVEPISMTAAVAGVGMAAGAAGGILGAFGSRAAGQAQANMYNYQAGVAQVNQKIAMQNAAYAREVGEVETQRVGMKGRSEVGVAKARQAGSGLDVTSGSPAMVRESMDLVNKQGQALTRSAAAKRAYGYEVEAMSQGAGATMAQMAGRESLRAGELGFYTSLLGTASSVSSKWLQGRSVGLV